MPALCDLQENFADAIFSADSGAGLMANLDPRDAAKTRAGIAAYRRSVFANLATSVNTSYPVIEAIVGPEFMSSACLRYAQAYPSTCGDLNLYGNEFATFLAGFEPAQSLPYLSDVARLEWQLQTVSGAADSPPQELSHLAKTPPDQWATLRFLIDPAHDIVSSRWPVVRIWQVNQPDYSGEFEVDFSQAQTALVHRRPEGPCVSEISPADSAFLRALSTRSTLDQAVTAACLADEHFDLANALTRFIAEGLLRQVI